MAFFSGFNTNALAPTPIKAANPLDTVNQTVQAQNALLGYKAQKAVGHAYQQSINPDGSFDANAFRSRVAGDPNASYAAGQALSDSQGQERAQTGNNNARLAYQEHARNAIGSIIASVGANPTPQNLAAGAAIAKRILPGQDRQIDQIVAGIQNHPGGIGEGVAQIATSMQSPEGQQASTYGTPDTLDDGSQIMPGVRSSAMRGGDFVQSQQGIDRTISPSQAAGQQSYTGPDGITRQANMGNVLQQEGAENVLPHNMRTRPTVPPEVMGNGRYPTSDQTQQPAIPVSGDGSFQVGQAPGQVNAQAAQAEAGASGANQLMQAASARNNRLSILNNMAGDLTQFTSGPGWQSRGRHLAAFLNNTFGADIDTKGVEAEQSFNKFSNQIAQAQAQALGVGTDAKLNSAMHANPNSSLQTDTNMQMIHVLQGNEDAINAKANAWDRAQQAGVPASQFQKWNQQFNQTFDPRVFQMQRMTPEERENVITQMKKSGTLADFKKSLGAMYRAGLVGNGQ